MRKISFFNAGMLAIGALAALWCVTGCSSSLYRDQNNWAIIDSDTPSFFAEYDLFYLYPCQELESEAGYMNWVYGNTGEEVRRYVQQVIAGQFGLRVRVFSPFVPLLSFREYGKILDEYKKERNHPFDFYGTRLKVPIDYTVEALNTYFSHHNKGDQPFVIFGQGQGALVLYEAMKRCKKVSPDNGFVAAYFFGMPGVHGEEIVADFGSRGIKPADKPTGVGVIAICNTRLAGQPLDKTLALQNGSVVNPLTWRIDAAPAGPKLNPGSMFVNHKEPNPAHRLKIISEFCGATVDPENGVVNITGVDAKKAAGLKLEEHVFYSDAWGLFSKSVSMNARDRVRMYNFRRKGVCPKED